MLQRGSQWRPGVTGGRTGGKYPSWQLRCGPLFRNGSSLIRLSLLPKQLLNFKPLIYENLLFYYCNSVLQSFTQVFFKWYLHCQDC